MSTPSAPIEVGVFDPPGYGYVDGVAVSGDLVFVVSSDNLFVVDVSTPSSPVQVGQVTGFLFAESLAASGDHAYISDQNGLWIVDASVPSSPIVVGYTPALDTARDVEVGDAPAGRASALAVSGNHVFVADDQHSSGGLRVFDVSDPASPTEVAFRPLPNGALAVAVSGNYAYVGGVHVDILPDLWVFDVSTPADPIEVFYGEGWGGDDAAVFGSYLYLVNDFIVWWLDVVDVSTPTNPSRVSHAVIGSELYPQEVVALDDHAYVACDSSSAGLVAVDVGDPTTPIVTTRIDTPGEGRDVAVAGSHVYHADTAGMNISRQCAIFADDFESGNTSAWDATTP